MNDAVRFYFLGRFRIEGSAGTIRLPTHKTEALLAYLILHPAAHSREKLAALFWGDSPARQARTSIRVALAAIRAGLGPDVLEAGHDTIQWEPKAGLWVDSLEFQSQAQRFLNGSGGELNQADLDLYQGDLLADFYDDWIAPLREHYRGLRLAMLLRHGQQLRARGEYERAAGCARQALAIDNLNEPAQRDLMICLAAQGDRLAALKQYAACHFVLRAELGIEPAPATTALYDWIKRSAPHSADQPAGLTNLPVPLTSFVGRSRELSEATQLFATTRLLTLTGVGGSGKTRLAIELAAALAPGFRDGVWWVELGNLTDPYLVPRAVAKAVGVRAESTPGLADEVAAQLRPRQVMLVLDNCEHLVAACAELAAQLLSTCHDLKILATSRETLAIAGEVAWRVPPLSLPNPDQEPTPIELKESESVRLFMERATAARPDLQLTAATRTAGAIVRVCRRLDGIPLAIELAAARVKVLSVEQIAARLDDRFALLAGDARGGLPRQQTLRAAMDWSYQLLTETERGLYRRLSVFAGGCTLEAAQKVAGWRAPSAVVETESPETEPDLLARLSRLVDKSLINVALTPAGARYHLLETVREFGLDQLRQAGEAEATRARHFKWCAGLVQLAGPHLAGPEQGQWFDRVEADLDNLRAALEWSLSSADWRADGLRLAAQLGQFWYVRGFFDEGRRWLERALAAGSGTPAPERSDALYWQGFLAWMQADYAVARSLFERSRQISEAAGDQRGIARALQNEGLVVARQGDYPAARELLKRSLGLQQQIGDQTGSLVSLFAAGRIAWFQGDLAGAHVLLDRGLSIAQMTGNLFLRSLALSSLGDVAWSEGNFPLAETLLTESLETFRRLGNRQNIATALLSLGYVALAQDDLAAAQARYAEGLVIYAQLGDKWGIANMLQGFGCLAAEERGPDRAARLLGAAAHLRTTLGAPVPIFYAAHEQHRLAVEAALGEVVFTAQWAAGGEWSLEQAIEYALIGATTPV